MNDPRAEYVSRLERWDIEIAHGERNHHRAANSRLVIGVSVLVVAVLAFLGRASAWWLAPAILAFMALVIVHDRVLQRLSLARHARRMYERGLARLDGTWQGSGPDGEHFLGDHPFARDLDLFGPASLFQLLDTARTDIGERTLADWIRHGAAPEEIISRQSAVAELSAKADFREAIGLVADNDRVRRTDGLAAWAAAPPAGLSFAIGVAFALCAATTLLLSLAVWQLGLDIRWLVGWVLIEGAIAMTARQRVNTALSGVDTVARDLASLSQLLERIEHETFVSPIMTRLLEGHATAVVRPSQSIRRLQQLVSTLDSCTNQIFVPVAKLLLVRSQIAVAIDRWHVVHGPAIPGWLRAIADVEALSSLATYAFEHPADPFPVIVVGGDAVFAAEGLGHPLLTDAVSVRNDVRLGATAPRVLVVSGSNMSGKSTLLRAIGVNVVLALAGAPVRAASLRLSRVEIGATLRVEDSLQAGVSKFYAEIIRIRSIVDVARGPVPLLFLLDEILGGTNSHDRRIGAEAIVKALVRYGAIGLITTHDLALTEFVSTLGSVASNVHLEDRMENGALVFDYRVRPGVVERSNALALMRAIGLEV